MKRLLSLLLFSMLAFASARAATTTMPARRPPAPKPAPNGERFLFVVDVSAAMRATEPANRQVLFDLIFSGIEGQMRTGDSFGLWLFNDAVRAGEFPVQVWEESKPLETASLAAKFLREQKYSGKSRPNVMMPRLLGLIKSVRNVNVILISDGEATLEGTPFDANIAAAYERRKPERIKAEKPFVTALIARDGIIVSGAVILGGEYVKLPERPALALVAKGTNNVSSPTNSAQTVMVSARPAPTNPPAHYQSGEPQIAVSLTPQPSSPPKPKAIQFATRPSMPAQDPVIAQPEPGHAPAAASAPPVPPTATLHSGQPHVNTPSFVENLLPQPMSILAREPSPPLPADAVSLSSPPPVNVAVASANGPGSALLLSIGGVLLMGCLGLLALALRRPKAATQASFISRSMERR